MNSEKLLNIISYTKNLKVLYVEDNLEVQEQTNKMLDSFFDEIILASNGKEAIDCFINQKFDLIITDIKMPLVDGLTFIEFVRKSNKKIPILIFSAHDDKEYFYKSVNEGIDGYILKPYTLSQITQSMAKIIEKYELSTDDSFTYLEYDYSWDNKSQKLYKNNQHIKLTKNETTLFNLFISSNCDTKTYEEIENSLFDFSGDNTKKLRNLITRLKAKLECDLFETMYSYGYTIKYKRN